MEIYQDRIGGSVSELEFYMSRMRNLVICYFVFKNQSHYSGVHGQRVKCLMTVACQTFVRYKGEGYTISQLFGVHNKMASRLVTVRI